MTEHTEGTINVTYRCGHTGTINYGTILDPKETESRILRDSARHDCCDCVVARRRWVRMRVSIDDLYPSDLEAYVLQEENWNGWRLPYFPKDQADKMIPINPGMRYDATKDAYILPADNGEDSDVDEYQGIDITVDGKLVHTYAIGAWSWIWDAEEL